MDRERRALYAGLAATWVVLGPDPVVGARGPSVGFEPGATPWNYFLNQLQLIAPLPVADRLAAGAGARLRPAARADASPTCIVPGVVVVALGLLTLVALWRWPMLGFLGAWFFVTLSPTSSFVPIATEVGAERRMYLPHGRRGGARCVVAVRWLIVRGTRWSGASRWRIAGGGHRGWRACCWAHGTVCRNARIPASRMRMAETIVDRRPHGRARFVLADELVHAGQHEQAVAQLRAGDRRTTRRRTSAWPPRCWRAGRTADAVIQAQTFIRLVPKQPGGAGRRTS